MRKLTIQGGLGPYRRVIIYANATALIVLALLVGASIVFAYDDANVFHWKVFTLNTLLCLLGVTLGWGAGILAIPIASKDPERFEKLGKIISAFLTGYVVSKLDRFLEGVLYSTNQPVAIAWQRVLLFSISFLVMLIVVVINRSYLHGLVSEPMDSPKQMGAEA